MLFVHMSPRNQLSFERDSQSFTKRILRINTGEIKLI